MLFGMVDYDQTGIIMPQDFVDLILGKYEAAENGEEPLKQMIATQSYRRSLSQVSEAKYRGHKTRRETNENSGSLRPHSRSSLSSRPRTSQASARSYKKPCTVVVSPTKSIRSVRSQSSMLMRSPMHKSFRKEKTFRKENHSPTTLSHVDPVSLESAHSKIADKISLSADIKAVQLAFKNADSSRSGVLVADELHHILDGFGCHLSAPEFSSIWNKYSDKNRTCINYSKFLKYVLLRQKGPSGIDPGWYKSRPRSSLAGGVNRSSSSSSLRMVQHNSSGKVCGYKSYKLLREKSRQHGKAMKKKDLDHLLTDEEGTIHDWFDDSGGVDRLQQWELRQQSKRNASPPSSLNNPGINIARELRPQLFRCWGELKKEMKALDFDRTGGIETMQLRGLFIKHGIALTTEDILQLSRAFPVKSGARNKIHYNNLLRTSLGT